MNDIWTKKNLMSNIKWSTLNVNSISINLWVHRFSGNWSFISNIYLNSIVTRTLTIIIMYNSNKWTEKKVWNRKKWTEKCDKVRNDNYVIHLKNAQRDRTFSRWFIVFTVLTNPFIIMFFGVDTNCTANTAKTSTKRQRYARTENFALILSATHERGIHPPSAQCMCTEYAMRYGMVDDWIQERMLRLYSALCLHCK